MLIFGGAYIQWGLSTEGNLRFKVDWASHIVGSKFTVFALFYVVFEGNFQKYKPPGDLYLEGRFSGGFFALPGWGAYFRNSTVFCFYFAYWYRGPRSERTSKGFLVNFSTETRKLLD